RMGFPDDVVIRVRAAEDGARVDMRSASRFGTHDFGANASRLRALSNDIDDVAGAEKPKPKAPPKPAPKKGAQPARRQVPAIAGGPSVATTPRATRSSSCATPESPAAPTSRAS